MSAHLFIKTSSNMPLDAFVREFSKRLGSPEFEERHSSNYREERYFRTSILGITVKAAIADEPEFQCYDKWLSFDVDGVYVEDTSFLDGVADCSARKLVALGFEVARPLDFGRLGGSVIVYRSNALKATSLRDQIITTKE